MYEHVTNDQIVVAIDDLFNVMGVKEELPGVVELLDLLRANETEACVQRMADWLGLPIRIELSYVAEGSTGRTSEGFQSASLSRTDVHGRSSCGITAQVSIPPSMPMIGTRGLEGYPIKVHASENCRKHPHAFLAVMAHELSHVLLASLWHPNKDSEVHADLVPLLLGLRGVASTGRRTVGVTTRDGETIQESTTYGYLPDEQFEFATRYVSQIVDRHRTRRDDLRGLASTVRALLQEVSQGADRFRDGLASLDARPHAAMSAKCARAVVGFHTPDYTRSWRIALAEGTSTLSNSEAFLGALIHYRAGTSEHLADHLRMLSAVRSQLQVSRAAIRRDLRILKHASSSFRQMLHGTWLRRLLPWGQ